jgi:hypothetical protein
MAALKPNSLLPQSISRAMRGKSSMACSHSFTAPKLQVVRFPALVHLAPPARFVPIFNVALAPWMQKAKQTYGAELMHAPASWAGVVVQRPWRNG